MTRRTIRTGAKLIIGLALVPAACMAANAATFGELSSAGPGPAYPRSYSPYTAGPYSAPPSAYGFDPQPTAGGAEGSIPAPLDAPGAATLPPPVMPDPVVGPNADLPHGTQQLWTFGQVNSSTDPFNPWGLSTPHMFVPWSTPLSGWSNAENWNWWRKRSGAVPRNW